MRLLIGLVLALFVQNSFAGASAETIAMVYQKALNDYRSLHLNFPVPNKPAEVHVVPQKDIQEYVTKTGAGGVQGTFYGLTLPSGVIYVADYDMDNKAFHRGTLYHEIIHFFQVQTRGATKDCADMYDREAEAYSMEARYLNSLQENGEANRVRLNLASALYQIVTGCDDGDSHRVN